VVLSVEAPAETDIGEQRQGIADVAHGQFFHSWSSFLEPILCSDLNWASADEHSPEPVHHPQARRRDRVIHLYPDETSGHEDAEQ
jgi:hypothetical protein